MISNLEPAVRDAHGVSDVPFLSVILSTRNRSDKLPACLKAIEAIRCSHRWELIVVDNGSTDDTPRLLDELQSRKAIEVVVVCEPKPGLARSQNRGLALARGDFIVFTDDDCYAAPDLLEQVVESMTRRTLDYLGGRVELFDPDDAPVTIKTDPEPFDIPPNSFLPAGLVHGCNMAFRRSVLEAIGSLNPFLGPGALLKSGADIELLQRASLAGFRGGYEPSVVTFHHHGRHRSELRQLYLRYAIGRGNLYGFLALRHTRFALNTFRQRRPDASNRFRLLKLAYWEVRRDPGIAWGIAKGFLGTLILYPLMRIVSSNFKSL